MSSIIGQRLGKYEIVELVGQGGMATVYKAYQPDVDRYVAVKVLPPHPGRDTQFVERFRQEATTIARLQHPHILPLYDYGEHDGILYLVMAYLSGGTLTRRIKQQGALPLSEVNRLLGQLAAALDYAHRQGVVHRDIKPDNVLLDSEGFALLTDFGIAKMMAGDQPHLTATGSMVGTPAYMSPEQSQGLPADQRSDVYSLGVMVYEMLAGRPPYVGEATMQVILKHLNAPIPSILEDMPHLPVGLDEVMLKVLAKSPSERYQTAAMFAQHFERTLSQSSLGSIRMQPGTAESATLQLDLPGTTPTVAGAGGAVTQVAPQPTVVVAPGGINALVLVGGLLLIGLLVVTVIVLALRPSIEVDQDPARIPTQVANVAPTTAAIQPRPTSAAIFGRVSFNTTTTPGDTLNLQVENLAPLASDERYAAWLHSADGTVLPLGALAIDGLGNGALTFTDADARTLPMQFNAMTITREQTVGDTPAGSLAYRGGLPDEVANALASILVASSDGIDGDSLLAGLESEARIAAQHAGLAAAATNAGGLHIHAEHTINILQGTRDDFNGDGSGQNPGKGFGLAYFLDRIEAALSDAANAADASASLQAQAELIRVCTQNTRTRMTRMIELEGVLLDADAPDAVVAEAAESSALAEQLIEGLDLNQNGRIEPFEGECGIQQIATYGILVGNFELVAAQS